jgi:hypothetical protein
MTWLLRLSTAMLSTAASVSSEVCYVCRQQCYQLLRLSTAGWPKPYMICVFSYRSSQFWLTCQKMHLRGFEWVIMRIYMRHSTWPHIYMICKRICRSCKCVATHENRDFHEIMKIIHCRFDGNFSSSLCVGISSFWPRARTICSACVWKCLSRARPCDRLPW